jgi:hypothetical protein
VGLMRNGDKGHRFDTNLYSLESTAGGDVILIVTWAGGDHRARKGPRKDGRFAPHFLIRASEKSSQDAIKRENDRLIKNQSRIEEFRRGMRRIMMSSPHLRNDQRTRCNWKSISLSNFGSRQVNI